MSEKPVVWVADIGSIQKQNFGWCRNDDGPSHKKGEDINAFAEGIAVDLSENRKIALGFECPTFVPITDDPGV